MNNSMSPVKQDRFHFRVFNRSKILVGDIDLFRFKKSILGINLLLIILLLIAGLWPFEFKPINAVDRLPDFNGIKIHNKCLIYEKTELHNAGISSFLGNTAEMTIELLVKPYRSIDDEFAAILCIYDNFDPELIMVARWKTNLIVRRRIPNPDGSYGHHEVSIANALSSDKTYHLLISMDRKAAAIYINGLPEKVFPGFHVQTGSEKSSGYRILLGNEPRVKTPWIGEIYGLALYNRSFNGRDAMGNYQAWSNRDYSSLSREKGIVALYPINEKGGAVLTNNVSQRINLIIPEHLYSLKKSFFLLPWINFWKYAAFYYDMIFNILGFIPLGFMLMAFFISWCGRKVLLYEIATVFVGSLLSLTFELIQVYMPARTSSLTDLLCNILGTVLGVVIFHKLYNIYLHKTTKPDEYGC